MKRHICGIGLMMLLLFAVGAAQGDLVAWWPLNEGSGQIVGDASGNGYDGFLGDSNADAVKDPAWVVDSTRGNVLEWSWGDFDEYVNLNDQISHFSGLTQGTIMAWINRDAVEEYPVDVILAASDSDDASSDLRFLVNYRPTAYNYDAIFYRSRNDGDVTKDVRTDGSTSPFGGWHHVAVTVPGAGGTVKLYIDGVEQPLDAAGITTMDFFAHVQDIDTMGLGRNVDEGGRTEMLFDGRMSDVAVCDVVVPGLVIAKIASDEWTPMAVDYAVTEGTPADGAIQIPTTSTLSWVQPPKAVGVTYNVYLGTDTNLSDDFVGSTTGTSFIPTLAAGKTYYWRVDTVTALDSYEGIMFSFTTEGATLNHYPWDGMEGADPYTQPLSWEGGPTIASYDVYWGQQGSMSFQTNTTDTTWTATGQSPDTVYEWRIDPRDSGNNLIATGDVLTYTTGALEAQWKLDEGSGITVTDSVGSANGTSVDDAWTDGVVPIDGSTFGSAMVFDSVDNLVRIPPQASLEGLPAMTVTVWARPGSLGYKPRIAGHDYQWYLMEKEGYPTFTVYGISTNDNPAQSPERVDPNDWYHVAGVCDGKDMKIYVNGVLKDTAPAIPFLTGTNSDITIGAQVRGTEAPYDYYNGRIDDVRIYSAALSTETIQSLYENSSLARNPIPADEDPAEPVLRPITTDLQWTKGHSVNLQDVYLVKVDPLYGEDPNFNEPGALVFSALNVSGNSVVLPDLEYDTQYGWRVDGKDSSTGFIAGNVWIFTTEPIKAYNPTPANGASDINAANPPALSWSKGGIGTFTYNVYFGTESGNLPQIGYDLTVETLAMPALAYDVTYFWRVDEVQGGTTYTGDEWSFSTVTPICDPVPVADISGPAGTPDCIVDLYDFTELAASWLTCNLVPVEACP